MLASTVSYSMLAAVANSLLPFWCVNLQLRSVKVFSFFFSKINEKMVTRIGFGCMGDLMGSCISYIGVRFNIISVVVILCTFVGRTISFGAFIATISGRRTWWTVVLVPAANIKFICYIVIDYDVATFLWLKIIQIDW